LPTDAIGPAPAERLPLPAVTRMVPEIFDCAHARWLAEGAVQVGLGRRMPQVAGALGASAGAKLTATPRCE
jgi:hypothetical protein